MRLKNGSPPTTAKCSSNICNVLKFLACPKHTSVDFYLYRPVTMKERTEGKKEQMFSLKAERLVCFGTSPTTTVPQTSKLTTLKAQ